MSDFQDISWVPQQHQQLQTTLSTLQYCVTCENLPIVDSLLSVCNHELQQWKLGSSQYQEDEWKKISDALSSGADKRKFRSPQIKFLFHTLLFGLIKMRIGLMDAPIPSPFHLPQPIQVSEPVTKKHVRYWVKHARDEFLRLVSPSCSLLTPGLFHFQENTAMPSQESSLVSRLLEQATAFSSIAEQGWLVATSGK